jgi:hypothetical protein
MENKNHNLNRLQYLVEILLPQKKGEGFFTKNPYATNLKRQKCCIFIHFIIYK